MTLLRRTIIHMTLSALPLIANAQFDVPVAVVSGVSIQQRIATDIEGDGDIDILLLLAEGGIVLLENSDGQGLFAPPVNLFDGSNGCSGFHAGDIDDDGDMDVLIRAGDDVEWVRNEGDGSWSSALLIGELPHETGALLLHDVSGDAVPDIIYIDTDELQPGLAVMVNIGGAFSEPAFTPDPVDGISGEVLVAADLDLVGGNDLVVRTVSGDLMVLRNNGDATEWSPAILLPTAGYAYTAPEVMDVDGDGDPDLVEAKPGAVHWAENGVGEGGAWNVFTEHVIEEIWTAGTGAFGRNGCDGVSLLYVPSNPFLPVRWSSWLGVLDEFGYRTDITEFPRGSAVGMADLDGDGRDDLLIERGGDLFWHRSVAVPATTDLVLPEMAAHCVFGAPLPLPAAEPAGGRWSGSWVDGDILYRANLGSTTDLTLAHTYYEPTGCPVAELDTLELLTGPRTFPELPPVLCSSDAPRVMTSIPDNTTWFGLADGNVLDPLQFAGGMVACEMVDPSGAGCATLLGPIEVWNALPTAITPAGPFCVDAGPQVITAFAVPPQGGVWSGDIVSSSPFQAVFDPSQGAGYYSVVLRTDPTGPQQCPGSDTLFILVAEDHPVVTLPAVSTFCQNGGAYPLEATPAGGDWAGAGVVDQVLYPELLDVGINNLTYTATSALGCTTVATWSVEVLDRAQVEWGTEDLIFCRTDPSVFLQGLPQGGTWSAPVWSDGEFAPGTLPAGNYPVTYTWTGPNDCQLVSDVITLAIWNDLPVTTEPFVPVCVTSEEAELVASHSGTWSGSIVGEGQSVIFSPASLGLGEWPVTITAVEEGYCPGTANTVVVVEVCSEMEDLAAASTIVAPNPFRDGFVVRLGGTPITALELLDASGRIIATQRPMSTEAGMQLDGLASGTYLLRVHSANGTEVMRMVKE
jgi:hypothetical protein